MATKRRSKPYKELKESLENNLVARGLVEDVFLDKLQEYMDLWWRRQQLEADIEARGVSVMDERRGMMVENRSISLLLTLLMVDVAYDRSGSQKDRPG